MVEVTVDQRSQNRHLPIDPADIPDAVKKRAAAVDALYTNGNGTHEQNGSGGDAQPPPVGAPEPARVLPTEPPTPQALDPARPTSTPAEPPAEPPAGPPADDDWRLRYERMQGRYNASQKTIGEMQEQMTQLGNELLHLQRMPERTQQPTRQPPPDAPSYLTEQDVAQYGNELIDVTQRAALHAVAPHLQALESQNAELRERLGQSARRSLDQAVELAVPNYREIDRDPRWHRWLLGVDVLSGRVRQQLLNEAISSAAAPRVISFFRGFQNEEAATGHNESAPSSHQPAAPREPAINLTSIAAPGRARPATGGDASLPPERPVYTHAQIRDLYSAHRKGAYVGREAEWARQELDIIAAGREGRVR